jgi:hypothetical protein
MTRDLFIFYQYIEVIRRGSPEVGGNLPGTKTIYEALLNSGACRRMLLRPFFLDIRYELASCW